MTFKVSFEAKFSFLVGTSNVLESLEQWTKDKEVVVPLSAGDRDKMVRLDASLWLETAADLFFEKLLSDEDIRTYFIDLENYRIDGYKRLKCILTASYVKRLGSCGMTQSDFSVLSNHFAATLSEMQIPKTIILRTVAALQSLKRCCQEDRRAMNSA